MSRIQTRIPSNRKYRGFPRGTDSVGVQQGVAQELLKPETIGLIPPGGYSTNRRYSKKPLMWLLHMERTDGCHIQHARNGREFRPPELPHYSVDGYCAETRTIYEFLGYYYQGCKCQPFRDVKTLASGETLAERYEQTMARIEQLKSVGYTVKVQWECEFEGADDLQRHPIDTCR